MVYYKNTKNMFFLNKVHHTRKGMRITNNINPKIFNLQQLYAFPRHHTYEPKDNYVNHIHVKIYSKVYLV